MCCRGKGSIFAGSPAVRNSIPGCCWAAALCDVSCPVSCIVLNDNPGCCLHLCVFPVVAMHVQMVLTGVLPAIPAAVCEGVVTACWGFGRGMILCACVVADAGGLVGFRGLRVCGCVRV